MQIVYEIKDYDNIRNEKEYNSFIIICFFFGSINNSTEKNYYANKFIEQ